MKAPQEILDGWKLQREFGDVGNINKDTGISRTTITSALNTGVMSKDTFNAIKDYFIKKRKDAKKLIAQTLK